MPRPRQTLYSKRELCCGPSRSGHPSTPRKQTANLQQYENMYLFEAPRSLAPLPHSLTLTVLQPPAPCTRFSRRLERYAGAIPAASTPSSSYLHSFRIVLADAADLFTCFAPEPQTPNLLQSQMQLQSKEASDMLAKTNLLFQDMQAASLAKGTSTSSLRCLCCSSFLSIQVIICNRYLVCIHVPAALFCSRRSSLLPLRLQARQT